MMEEIESDPKYSRKFSRRFCSYKGCSSDLLKTRNGAISFFGFPVKDTERCSVWISSSGREEFRFLTPRELGEKRICEFHFERKMFTNEFRTHLSKRAIPISCSQSPELIQIDDDEVENYEYEGVSEDASNNNVATVNGHSNHEIAPENETDRLNFTTEDREISHTAPTNGEKVVEDEQPVEDSSLLESSPADKQSTEVTSSITVHGKGSPKGVQSSSRAGPTFKKKTKFHNLPPLINHSDFFYQQCPSIDETNSYPEPPDVEMPLFVQQNSVVSLADEAANSDVSEPASKKRKRDKDNDDDDNLGGQMRDAMKHLRNITSLLTNTEDEFELFGKSVALQLKKMSLCTAITAQAKLQQVLSECRVEDIKGAQKITPHSVDSSEKQPENKIAEEEELPSSPQLSLTCASEASDNEINEIS